MRPVPALGTLTLLLAVGCGQPTVNVIEALSVVNWSPHDGASCIGLDAAPSVCLSRDLSEASLEAISLHPSDGTGAMADSKVTVTASISETEPGCAVLTPTALTPATDYFIVLEPELTAADGTALDRRLIARFRTEDDTCP